MRVSINWGGPILRVLITRALLLAVHMWRPGSVETPTSIQGHAADKLKPAPEPVYPSPRGGGSIMCNRWCSVSTINI